MPGCMGRSSARSRRGREGRPVAGQSDTVVLLHGIARTRLSLSALERVIAAAGDRTLNLTYPSRRLDLDGIAAWLDAKLRAAGLWQGGGKVHFVTHSMGGLVAARYLAAFRDRDGEVGRVVMLAPPSQGSEVADAMHELPPYRWFYGPAGQQLTTAARAIPMPVDYELGIIAGTGGGAYPLGRLLISGPHDGRVAVARTKVAGMRDHLVVTASHSFIMRRPDVQRQVLHFLAHGRFAAP